MNRLPLIAVLLVLTSGCRVPAPAADAAPGAPLFTDEAEHAGIRFQLDNGARGKHHLIETTGSGCAFFDYDRDGYPDVLLVQAGPQPWSGEKAGPGPHNRLYHNLRDGTFADVTAGSGLEDTGYSQAAAVGDVDGDGFQDVLVTAYGGNHLLRNLHGSGKFADITAASGLADRAHGPRWATSAAFGDYNNDGKLDLYECRYAVYDPRKEKACLNPLGDSSYCSPELYQEEIHALYRGNGDGTFTDVSGPAGITRSRGRGLGVAWLDYDGDGWEDLFVANDLSPFMLWRNNGNGTFTNTAERAGVAFSEMGQLLSGMGVAVRDYNGDGLEDLFITNFSGQMNALFRNGKGGAFTNATIPSGIGPASFSRLAFGCEFIDVDRDGLPDLVVGNGHVNEDVEAYSQGVSYAQPKSLLRNQGNGVFTELTTNTGALAVPRVTRGLAAADYDLDGNLDLLATNHDGPTQLLRYTGPQRNHWVAFDLRGTRSNPDGYHARVTVRAGALTSTAELRSGSSYASHSLSRLYFGLGPAARVDEVRITWHGSRTVTRLSALDADRIYRVVEGGEAKPLDVGQERPR